MISPKNSFKGTLESLSISLGLALLTAFATWLATITDLIDFGTYAPLVGSLAIFAVNAIRKFIQSNE